MGQNQFLEKIVRLGYSISERGGPAETNSQQNGVCMQSKHKKILVVDDETDILEFLNVLLEEEGYLVVITDKGEYIEELLNGGLPDLILLDMLLSGKDGREIVKQLKRQEETKHIPVIMFSAHPSAAWMAREAGADDFIDKPFDIDDLLSTVARNL